MELENIKNIGVVGAGTMGHAIAQNYAQAGFPVKLMDISEQQLQRALSLIKMNLETLAEFNLVDNKQIDETLSKITTSTDLKGSVGDLDVITEAVSENPELKKEIFSILNDYCREDTILASNTSTLDIFKIVKKSIKNLSRFLTHHYFHPAFIIPSVEICVGKKTSPEVLDVSIKLIKKIGKTPIVLEKFSPEYIVNAIQKAINSTMYSLIKRGIATPEQIDFAIKTTLGVRLPFIGICQSNDFTGLDLLNDILTNMGANVPQISEKVEQGHLGVKTGKGWYDYKGRSELEVNKKRDRLFLKNLRFLKENNAFDPI